MIALTVVLQPLLNLMDERLRSSGYVRIDETRVQVLNSDKAPSALHWMWVRSPDRKINGSSSLATTRVAAARSPTRSSRVAAANLQSDGYQAYEGVSERAGLLHVGVSLMRGDGFSRRLKPCPTRSANKRARHMKRCGASMRFNLIERQIKDLQRRGAHANPQRRSRGRSLHPARVAGRMQHETMPSGKLGEALGYLITQWPKLVRYVEDPAWRSTRTSPKMRSDLLHLGAGIGFSPTPSRAQEPARALQHRLHRPR